MMPLIGLLLRENIQLLKKWNLNIDTSNSLIFIKWIIEIQFKICGVTGSEKVNFHITFNIIKFLYYFFSNCIFIDKINKTFMKNFYNGQRGNEWMVSNINIFPCIRIFCLIILYFYLTNILCNFFPNNPKSVTKFYFFLIISFLLISF